MAIKQDIAKFVGMHGSISKVIGSQIGLEDVLLYFLELYKPKLPKGDVFAYIHALQILKDIPLWDETKEEVSRGGSHKFVVVTLIFY